VGLSRPWCRPTSRRPQERTSRAALVHEHVCQCKPAGLLVGNRRVAAGVARQQRHLVSARIHRHPLPSERQHRHARDSHQAIHMPSLAFQAAFGRGWEGLIARSPLDGCDVECQPGHPGIWDVPVHPPWTTMAEDGNPQVDSIRPATYSRVRSSPPTRDGLTPRHMSARLDTRPETRAPPGSATLARAQQPDPPAPQYPTSGKRGSQRSNINSGPADKRLSMGDCRPECSHIGFSHYPHDGVFHFRLHDDAVVIGRVDSQLKHGRVHADEIRSHLYPGALFRRANAQHSGEREHTPPQCASPVRAASRTRPAGRRGLAATVSKGARQWRRYHAWRQKAVDRAARG
jgi:hypothetical protein